MDKTPNRFGEYLKQLIKSAKMTQVDFYMQLGITKPYFYDILSGKVNPPPPPLQFKVMKILNADESTRIKFFDLAAKARGEMPADITSLVDENPSLISDIRNNLKQILSKQKRGNRYE